MVILKRPDRLVIPFFFMWFAWLVLVGGSVPGLAADSEMQLVREVKALFGGVDTDLHPKSGFTRIRSKSGTPIMEKVRRMWDDLSEETQEALRPYLMRPDDEYGSDHGAVFKASDVIDLYMVRVDGRDHVGAGLGIPRFLIHYTVTTDSPNAVSLTPDAAGNLNMDGVVIPDYVADVADVLADVYGFFDDIFSDNDFQMVKPNEIATNNVVFSDGESRPSNGYAPVHGAGGDLVGGVDVGALYDVYLVDLNTYGMNVSASLEDQEAHNPDREYTSYIVMDNDYGNYYVSAGDAIKVTAAHEFFHAVQRAYDPYAEMWFMESSSVWLEDELHDDVNDYLQYLDSWFDAPYKSLATSDNWHEYGSVMWSKFLSENYTSQTQLDAIDANGGLTAAEKEIEKGKERARAILQVWREMDEGYAVFSAVDDVLKNESDGAGTAYGSTAAAAIREFWIWNYFTGSNNPVSTATETYYMDDDSDDTGHVAAYPAVTINRSVSDYPLVTITPTTNLPRSFSTNYLEFVANSSVPRDLVIDFDGADGINWEVALIKVKSDGSVETDSTIVLDTSDKDGAVTIQSFGLGQTYEKVIMLPINIPTNLSSFSTLSSGKYTYSTTVGYPKLDKGEVTSVYNYPNPTTTGTTTIHYNLVRTTDVSVLVTDVTGKLIKVLVDGQEQDAGDNPQLVEWDGENERGYEVANGVYFYKIRVVSPTGTDDTVKSGRVVILR